MTEPDFWNDNIAAQKTSQELNELKNTYNTFHKMDELQDEVEILLDFWQKTNLWRMSWSKNSMS